MKWIKAGSLRLSRSGKALVIVVNNHRFIANAKDAMSVLTGKRRWCGLSHPSE